MPPRRKRLQDVFPFLKHPKSPTFISSPPHDTPSSTPFEVYTFDADTPYILEARGDISLSNAFFIPTSNPDNECQELEPQNQLRIRHPRPHPRRFRPRNMLGMALATVSLTHHR
jgi:hypothetical protein